MPVITLSGQSPPSDQIYQQLRGTILAGQLVTGEKLPPVRQLARDLAVAPGTVAKAYKLLEQDNLVISRAGAGTRVSAKVVTTPSAVLQAARALAETANNNGLDLDGAMSALRASWANEYATLENPD